MRNWENYGDVNFFEYGGVLLDVDKDINESMGIPTFCVSALQLLTDGICDMTSTCSLVISYIDVLDWESNVDELCRYTGETPEAIKNAISEYRNGSHAYHVLHILKRYAVDIVENLSVYTSYHTNVNVLEAHKILQSYDVPAEWNGTAFIAAMEE